MQGREGGAGGVVEVLGRCVRRGRGRDGEGIGTGCRGVQLCEGSVRAA